MNAKPTVFLKAPSPLLKLKQRACGQASWVLDTAKTGVPDAVWCPFRALRRVFPEESAYILSLAQLEEAMARGHQTRFPSWIELGEGEDIFVPSVSEERRQEVLRMMRHLLERGIGLAFTTRGSLEHAQGLLEIAKEHAKGLVIRVGVFSADPTLEKKWEPGLPSRQHRLALAQELQSLGARVEVEIGPIVPFANDDAKGIRDLSRLIAGAGLSQITTRWIEDAPALERQIEAEISPSTARLVTGWFRHAAYQSRGVHRRVLPLAVRAPRIVELKQACALYGLSWSPCECEQKGQSSSCLLGRGGSRGAQLSLLELIA